MNYSNRQQGAVLVMALVLLIVLTLIGVASMQGSSMELKVASNAQQRNTAFEAAQSLIDIAASLDDPVNTNDYQTFIADSTLAGYKQLISYTPMGLDIAANSVTTWDDCAKQVGSSLEEGKGFSMNSFSVRSAGQTTTGSATSTQLQGVRFPAAACPEI